MIVVFLLAAAGLLGWLASRRFRASALLRSHLAAADGETALLRAQGHVMLPWVPVPALGGVTSECVRCEGTCVVTADEIIHALTLARNGELLPCTGGAP